MRSSLATLLAGPAAAVTLLLAPGAVAAPATSLAAPTICSPGVVSDAAGVLDAGQVRRAARELGDDVVVKVITYDRIPGSGDLYDALQDARITCGGWGFEPWGGQSLLVLGVSVAPGDRELGSHYDGAALKAFDRVNDAAEGDAMGPQFGNGAYTEGMVAGLGVYAAAYERAATAPGNGGGSGIEGGSGPGGGGAGRNPLTGDTTQGGGSSAGEGVDVDGWMVAAPLGTLALGGAAAGRVVVRRRLKAREQARAELMTATNEMAQAWVELEDSQEYVDARVTTLPAVSDSAVDAIRRAHDEATASIADATARYLEASASYDSAKVSQLGTDEAVAGLEPVRATTASLTTARAAIAAVERAVSSLETLRAELPGRVATLREQAAVVDALLGRRRAEGYMTGSLDAAPTEAEQAAREAESLGAELRFGDADAVLVAGTAALAADRAWLEGLDDYRADLATDTATLHQRAETLDAALAEAYVTTEALERDYHPSCVIGLREGVDAAMLERRRLDGALSVIETNSSMRTQEFRAAREQIGRAQTACDGIAASAAAAGALEAQLRELAAELPLTAQRLEAQAEALGELIDTHSAAVAYLPAVPAVEELRVEAQVLGDRAREPKAALLELDAEAHQLDDRLVQGRSVIDAVIAEYDDAQRALRAAASALSEAEQEVRHSDVGAAARSIAAEAADLLRRADVADDLVETRRVADAAKERANEASARARRDQREAQQRRDAEARRRRQAASAASAARGRSSSSSSRRSSGGGSRGGSRGGGGSRSFGGGGSRRSGGGGSRKF
ncbi:coiled-coil domain-containing protein [Nocardioides pacificus]